MLSVDEAEAYGASRCRVRRVLGIRPLHTRKGRVADES